MGLICCLLCLLSITTLAFAEQQEPNEPMDFLEMSIEELLEIEISVASKKPEPQFEAPGVISVITKDELERFGGTTLKDILERVPSLIGSTVYMTDRSMIAVRGDQVTHSGNHVLLLLNGRPVREVLEGGIKSEILESFPVNIIEKIEVIRGPGSVLYGSGAFSGVINVITEKAEENDITITGLAGESGAYNTLAKAKYIQGDFSMIVAGRYHEKPDWETTWDYENVIGMTGSEEVHIYDKGPGSYLEINYKNLRFMASYNEWQNYFFIPDYMLLVPGSTFGNAYWKKSFADLGYGLEVNDKWDMDLNLTYTGSTFKVDSWPDIERDSYELIAECTNFISATEKLNIVFGGLYSSCEGEEIMKSAGDWVTINDSSQTSYGVYTQADYSLLENLKLIGGAQANKVENIDLDVVSRAGVIWHLVPSINFKVLYSEAFRAPSINEIGLNHPAMQGNPNLKPEKVETIDIGLNYSGDQVQCGVNYFFSKQSDVIFQDRVNYAVPTYDNIGEFEIQGFEFEGKYYVNKNLLLIGSALYQTNEDEDGEENVTPIANFGAKAGISYKSEKGVTVSLFNIYQGYLDEKYDTQVNPPPGAYNLMNLYCRFDMNKFFDWERSQEVSLLLQVDNLLDEEIWLPNWGLASGNSIPVDQGRTIYFGMEVSF